MKIQDFSRKTGLSQRMLRYLEDQGLLIPDRRENGYREYRQAHWQDYQRLQLWQALGFSYAQIKNILTLDSEAIEQQIEHHFERKKKEVEQGHDELLQLRSMIREIRNSPLPDQFNHQDWDQLIRKVTAWPQNQRQDFLTSLTPPSTRVIYGKFPELDIFADAMIDACRPIKLDCAAIDIIKVGSAVSECVAGETLLLDRPHSLTYLFLHLPEQILRSSRCHEIEDQLQLGMIQALRTAFGPEEIVPAGRLMNPAGILQYSAATDVTFRIRFQLIGLSSQCLEAFISYSLIQQLRASGSFESSQLARDLRSQILRLNENQMRQATQHIPNELFLLTYLLADGETRTQMSRVLSPAALELIQKDIHSLRETIQKSWFSENP